MAQQQQRVYCFLPGFMFKPNDMDALGYLARKVLCGIPAPLGVIPELSVYDVPPWELAGDRTYSIADEFYCFTRLRRSNPNNARPGRTVGSVGSWVACGKHVHIIDESGRTVGHKTFYKYKGTETTSAADGAGDRWIMYEYRLEEATFPTASLQDVKNVVMCLIKTSSRSGVKEYDQGEAAEQQQEPPLAPAPTSAAAAPPPCKRKVSTSVHRLRQPAVQRLLHQSLDAGPRSAIPWGPLSLAATCPPASSSSLSAEPVAAIPVFPPPEVLFQQATLTRPAAAAYPTLLQQQQQERESMMGQLLAAAEGHEYGRDGDVQQQQPPPLASAPSSSAAAARSYKGKGASTFVYRVAVQSPAVQYLRQSSNAAPWSAFLSGPSPSATPCPPASSSRLSPEPVPLAVSRGLPPDMLHPQATWLAADPTSIIQQQQQEPDSMVDQSSATEGESMMERESMMDQLLAAAEGHEYGRDLDVQQQQPPPLASAPSSSAAAARSYKGKGASTFVYGVAVQSPAVQYLRQSSNAAPWSAFLSGPSPSATPCPPASSSQLSPEPVPLAVSRGLPPDMLHPQATWLAADPTSIIQQQQQEPDSMVDQSSATEGESMMERESMMDQLLAAAEGHEYGRDLDVQQQQPPPLASAPSSSAAAARSYKGKGASTFVYGVAVQSPAVQYLRQSSNAAPWSAFLSGPSPSATPCPPASSSRLSPEPVPLAVSRGLPPDMLHPQATWLAADPTSIIQQQQQEPESMVDQSSATEGESMMERESMMDQLLAAAEGHEYGRDLDVQQQQPPPLASAPSSSAAAARTYKGKGASTFVYRVAVQSPAMQYLRQSSNAAPWSAILSGPSPSATPCPPASSSRLSPEPVPLAVSRGLPPDMLHPQATWLAADPTSIIQQQQQEPESMVDQSSAMEGGPMQQQQEQPLDEKDDGEIQRILQSGDLSPHQFRL